jgi:hypothetical protein
LAASPTWHSIPNSSRRFRNQCIGRSLRVFGDCSCRRMLPISWELKIQFHFWRPGRLPRRANYEGPSRAIKRSLPASRISLPDRHGRQITKILANRRAAANTAHPVSPAHSRSANFSVQ